LPRAGARVGVEDGARQDAAAAAEVSDTLDRQRCPLDQAEHEVDLLTRERERAANPFQVGAN